MPVRCAQATDDVSIPVWSTQATDNASRPMRSAKASLPAAKVQSKRRKFSRPSDRTLWIGNHNRCFSSCQIYVCAKWGTSFLHVPQKHFSLDSGLMAGLNALGYMTGNTSTIHWWFLYLRIGVDACTLVRHAHRDSECKRKAWSYTTAADSWPPAIMSTQTHELSWEKSRSWAPSIAAALLLGECTYPHHIPTLYALTDPSSVQTRSQVKEFAKIRAHLFHRSIVRTNTESIQSIHTNLSKHFLRIHHL